jgi:hypothetical protein
MKKNIFLLLLSTFILSACSGSGNKSDVKNIPQEANEVKIIIHQTEKGEESFPLHDTITIPLKSISFTTGRFSSLTFTFTKNEPKLQSTFEVFLPAAPRFELKEDAAHSVTIDGAAFPLTLKGSDYKPHKNAVDTSEVNMHVWLQSIEKSSGKSDIINFDLNEITIESFDFITGNANSVVSMKVIQKDDWTKLYGKSTAEVVFSIVDFKYSVLILK